MEWKLAIISTIEKCKNQQELKKLVDDDKITPGTNLPWMVTMCWACYQYPELAISWIQEGKVNADIACMWDNFLLRMACMSGTVNLAQLIYDKYDVLNGESRKFFKDGVELKSRPVSSADEDHDYQEMDLLPREFKPQDESCLGYVVHDWFACEVPRKNGWFYRLFYDCTLHFQLETAQWVWKTFKLNQEEKAPKKLPFLFLYACMRTKVHHPLGDLLPIPANPVNFDTKTKVIMWLSTLSDPEKTTVDPTPEGYETVGDLPTTIMAAYEKCRNNDDEQTAKFLQDNFSVVREESQKKKRKKVT